MRYDSLSQILSQSGVCAGSRVMVVESTVGMVTGSVAYRMRGQGRVLSIYGGQQPHLDMVKLFNLEEKDINIIQARWKSSSFNSIFKKSVVPVRLFPRWS